MPVLRELKGQDIVLCLTNLLIEQKHRIILTKLVEVEDAGIWVEGRDLAEFLHNLKQEAIIPRMPLFFVPFAQIAWISGSADYPSLSESKFGL
jgi:hypothetical protein